MPTPDHNRQSAPNFTLDSHLRIVAQILYLISDLLLRQPPTRSASPLREPLLSSDFAAGKPPIGLFLTPDTPHSELKSIYICVYSQCCIASLLISENDIYQKPCHTPAPCSYLLAPTNALPSRSSHQCIAFDTLPLAEADTFGKC